MAARLTRTSAIAVVVVIAASWPLFATAAEIKMTDLNGEWRGSGTSRNLPLESFEATTCRTTIRADERNMTTEMVCEGKSGLRKVIMLKSQQNGSALSGTVSQTTTTPGGAPTELSGTMRGHRTDNTANFLVHWSGWQPDTTVALRMGNSSSFSMHVSALGITMMNVAFNRTSKN